MGILPVLNLGGQDVHPTIFVLQQFSIG